MINAISLSIVLSIDSYGQQMVEGSHLTEIGTQTGA